LGPKCPGAEVSVKRFRDTGSSILSLTQRP